MTLSEAERRRLAAILGMLGSGNAGERDNAARLAEQARHASGLSWAELLNLPEIEPEPTAAPSPPEPPQPTYSPPPPSPVIAERLWHDPAYRDAIRLTLFIVVVVAVVWFALVPRL